MSLKKALRWRKDDKAYAATTLVAQILHHREFEPGGIHGLRFWKTPNGRTLSDIPGDLQKVTCRGSQEPTLAER